MRKAAPKFRDMRLVDSGWLNKYVLTYELTDGSLYEYEAISRKGPDEYRRTLVRNGQAAAVNNGAVGNGAVGNGSPCENGAASGFPPEAQSDAVCIIPFLPDGSILLIREFRYPVNGWIVAFPAGLIEPGEDIVDCIDRELGEETGFRMRRDVEEPVRFFAQSGFSSVGMSDENVRVAVAQVEDSGTSQDLQEGELIERFVLPRKDIGGFLDTNRDLIGTRCQLVLEALRESENILGLS